MQFCLEHGTAVVRREIVVPAAADEDRSGQDTDPPEGAPFEGFVV